MELDITPTGATLTINGAALSVAGTAEDLAAAQAKLDVATGDCNCIAALIASVPDLTLRRLPGGQWQLQGDPPTITDPDLRVVLAEYRDR